MDEECTIIVCDKLATTKVELALNGGTLKTVFPYCADHRDFLFEQARNNNVVSSVKEVI